MNIFRFTSVNFVLKGLNLNVLLNFVGLNSNMCKFFEVVSNLSLKELNRNVEAKFIVRNNLKSNVFYIMKEDKFNDKLFFEDSQWKQT